MKKLIIIISALALFFVSMFVVGYFSELHDTSLDKIESIFTDNKADFISCGEYIEEYLLDSDNRTLSITNQNYAEYFTTELFSKHLHQIFAEKEGDIFEISFIFRSQAKGIEWGIIYSNGEVETGQPIRELTENWYAYRIAYT